MHSAAMVTRTNNQRKGEFHISHLVENPWALGIHQETRKSRKSTQKQKGQKLVQQKIYIIIFAQSLEKLKPAYLTKSLYKIQLKYVRVNEIVTPKQRNYCTKISVMQNFQIQSLICSDLYTHCCIISQNHKRRQLLLNKL